ncbi:MAG: histidine kinase [Lewinella sp.]
MLFTRLPRSVILQVTVWIGLLLLFTLTGDTASRTARDYVLIFMRVGGIALYYNLLYYLVLPLYFSGRKRAFYLWGGLALLLFIGYSVGTDYYLFDFSRRGAGDGSGQRPLAFLFIPAIFIGLATFGVAATFRGFLAFDKQKRAEREANRQRLEAEIALLKSQINPHFLLNTINNLYALSLTEPDKTPDALLRLSEMVSYILYECASPRVTLERDLQFVESYVDLQRLRLPPNAKLEVSLPDRVSPALLIEPMILVPFIENAFKHGLTTKQDCTIRIAISIAGEQLQLMVSNLLLPKRASHIDSPSGIGMTNTRQRLDYSYAGRYELVIGKETGIHRVDLTLNLHQ